MYVNYISHNKFSGHLVNLNKWFVHIDLISHIHDQTSLGSLIFVMSFY